MTGHPHTAINRGKHPSSASRGSHRYAQAPGPGGARAQNAGGRRPARPAGQGRVDGLLRPDRERPALGRRDRGPHPTAQPDRCLRLPAPCPLPPAPRPPGGRHESDAAPGAAAEYPLALEGDEIGNLICALCRVRRNRERPIRERRPRRAAGRGAGCFGGCRLSAHGGGRCAGAAVLPGGGPRAAVLADPHPGHKAPRQHLRGQRADGAPAVIMPPPAKGCAPIQGTAPGAPLPPLAPARGSLTAGTCVRRS